VRAVIQRVSESAVVVDGTEVARIGQGFVVLVAIVATDTEGEVAALVDKVAGLRAFPDDDGRMHRSIVDVGGSVLVVSQFTLVADVRRGRRPSFTAAAEPRYAEPLVHRVAETFRDHGVPASSGVFGATMEISLVNQGPVTFVLDVEEGRVR